MPARSISVDAIARMTGLSESAALDGVNELIEAGFLQAVVVDGVLVYRQTFPDGRTVE
jgi:hypothetical protein